MAIERKTFAQFIADVAEKRNEYEHLAFGQTRTDGLRELPSGNLLWWLILQSKRLWRWLGMPLTTLKGATRKG